MAAFEGHSGTVLASHREFRPVVRVVQGIPDAHGALSARYLASVNNGFGRFTGVRLHPWIDWFRFIVWMDHSHAGVPRRAIRGFLPLRGRNCGDPLAEFGFVFGSSLLEGFDAGLVVAALGLPVLALDAGRHSPSLVEPLQGLVGVLTGLGRSGGGCGSGARFAPGVSFSIVAPGRHPRSFVVAGRFGMGERGTRLIPENAGRPFIESRAFAAAAANVDMARPGAWASAGWRRPNRSRRSAVMRTKDACGEDFVAIQTGNSDTGPPDPSRRSPGGTHTYPADDTGAPLAPPQGEQRHVEQRVELQGLRNVGVHSAEIDDRVLEKRTHSTGWTSPGTAATPGIADSTDIADRSPASPTVRKARTDAANCRAGYWVAANAEPISPNTDRTMNRQRTVLAAMPFPDLLLRKRADIKLSRRSNLRLASACITKSGGLVGDARKRAGNAPGRFGR